MAFESDTAAIPDWIVKRRQERAASASREQETELQNAEVSTRVNREGADFWHRLGHRLKVNTDLLESLGDELVGSTSFTGDLASGGEVNYHVAVNRQSVRRGVRLCHSVLFFQQGHHRIRHWFEDREFPDNTLHAKANVKGIFAVSGNSVYTAEALADSIVEFMASRVRV